MIGSGLKKFAKENGMTVSKGVAYGSLRGFNATMSEGAGYKSIVFSTKITDLTMKGGFTELLERTELNKTYRVLRFEVGSNAICVTFHDTIGTMKKIRAFVDWFIPVLTQYGASGSRVCPECGGEVSSGKWVMVDGVCHYLHPTCAEKIKGEVASYNEEKKEAQTGSYVSGAVGAILGAAVGAVVWAVVLLMGYVASLVGLLIGWLAQFGYNLFRGKQGKGKIAILILAIIFGVILGTLGAEVLTCVDMISSGELTYATYADIPTLILFTLETDAGYRSAMLQNVGLGLLFAALGVYALLRQANKNVADTKYTEM